MAGLGFMEPALPNLPDAAALAALAQELGLLEQELLGGGGAGQAASRAELTLKLHDAQPETAPVSPASRALASWLAAAPFDLDTHVRRGCVLLTLDVLAPAGGAGGGGAAEAAAVLLRHPQLAFFLRGRAWSLALSGGGEAHFGPGAETQAARAPAPRLQPARPSALLCTRPGAVAFQVTDVPPGATIAMHGRLHGASLAGLQAAPPDAAGRLEVHLPALPRSEGVAFLSLQATVEAGRSPLPSLAAPVLLSPDAAVVAELAAAGAEEVATVGFALRPGASVELLSVAARLALARGWPAVARRMLLEMSCRASLARDAARRRHAVRAAAAAALFLFTLLLLILRLPPQPRCAALSLALAAAGAWLARKAGRGSARAPPPPPPPPLPAPAPRSRPATRSASRERAPTQVFQDDSAEAAGPLRPRAKDNDMPPGVPAVPAPLRLSKLAALKAAIGAQAAKGDSRAATWEDRSDAALERFLRARDWAVEPAASLFLEHRAWRAQLGWEVPAASVAPRAFAARMLALQALSSRGGGQQPGLDTAQPLLILLPLRLAARHQGSVQAAEARLLLVHAMDRACDALRPGGRLLVLLDLGGVSLQAMDVQLLRTMAEMLQRRYPERVEAVWLARPSLLLRALLRLAAAFVAPRTREKMRFVGAAELRALLLARFEAADVPAEFGGEGALRPLTAEPLPWEDALLRRRNKY